MATIATQLNSGSGFASGEVVTATKLNSLVNTATVTGIVNDNIDAAAAIAGSKLADGGVVTAKIADAAVTAAKLAANAVEAVKINDSAVTTAKINNAAVTASKLDGAQTGSAPIYGCRAWVNFNGTRNATDTGSSANGANVLIRASGNVSSVLKNATGDYTITFTSALPNANYCLVGTSTQALAGSGNGSSNVVAVMTSSSNTYATRTTSSVRVVTIDNNSDALYEAFEVSLAIFG